MKFMKKLAGVLAATVLSVGMLAGTAFALDNTTVTVSGVASGDTVTAYKIAGVEVTASNELKVTMREGLPADYDTIEEIKNVTSASDIKAMTNAIANKIPVDAADKIVSVNGELSLDPGYYLLRTTATSGETKVYQLTTISVWPIIDANNQYAKKADFTVEMKSVPAPTVTKKIVVSPTSEVVETDAYADGATVSMKIDSTIPSYPVDSTNATYVITDTYVNMTNINNLKVYVGGAEVESPTVVYTNNGFTVSFDNAFCVAKASQSVLITFDADLAINAALDGKATNTAKATYNPGPYNNATTDTDPSTVTAKTYGFYFQKFGAATDTAAEKLMPGTTFDLYSGTGDSKVKIEGVVLTADANGYVYWDGLAAGTYTLVETKAGIAGFGMVDPFTVELTAGACTVDNLATPAAAETNYVAAGTEGKVIDPVAEVPTLPTTGGMGTIVFSVLGVLIMAAAVVLFVRRKQSEK